MPINTSLIITMITICCFISCSEGGSSKKKFEHIPEDETWKPIERNIDSDNDQPKIAIVSHYTTDENNMGFIKLATDNHKKYAKKHGYDYIFRNGTITDEFFWPEGENRTFQLGLYWQKIAAVEELLNEKMNGKFRYDYVFWIDTDAIFTDLDRKIESFIEKAEEDDFYIGSEDITSYAIGLLPHTCINTGVFIIKNSVKGRRFIEDIKNAFWFYKDRLLPEQAAISDFIFGHMDSKKLGQLANGPVEKVLVEKNKVMHRKCALDRQATGAKIFLMKDFNSPYHWPHNHRATWDKDSFVAHFLGLHGQVCADFMSKLIGCLELYGYSDRQHCTAQKLNVIFNDTDDYGF